MKYTITQKTLGPDGLCTIERADGLPLTPGPRRTLFQALSPHGFIAKDYEKVCEALDKTGRIEIDVPHPARVQQFYPPEPL
jgi:hypothetical protein